MRRTSLRQILLLAIIALVLLLLSIPRQGRPTPEFPTDIIQWVWFPKPPADGNLERIAENYDIFILSRNDEEERDRLRDLRVRSPILQYVLALAVHNPGPEDCQASPWGNSVAWKPGDYCWIRDHHPDWILRDIDGEPIRESIGAQQFVHMDPGSEGWRQYFLQQLHEDKGYAGWDGIFLEGVDGSLNRYRSLDQLPAKYPDDLSFQSAMADYLDFLHTAFFKPNGRPLFANLTNLAGAGTWESYLRFLDGVMDESWAVDGLNGYRGPEEWADHLHRAEVAQDLGKHVLLISQGSEETPRRVEQPEDPRQTFAYASYLLVARGQAAFRYGSQYAWPWAYPDYGVDLGEPLGPRFQDGSSWRRNFTGGTVTVDPAAQMATISTSTTSAFSDVPFSHWAFEYVEALYDAQYTSGCATEPLRYCPDAPMNRAETAVLILRGIHGSEFTPTAPATQIFGDLPLDSWATPWATALYNDGYTGGCGDNPLVFCPWRPLSRAEAAVFFVKMLKGPDVIPPQPESPIFADVPRDEWFAKWVAAASSAGLVRACQELPEPRFCPEEALTRDVAAFMLARAKNLVP